MILDITVDGLIVLVLAAAAVFIILFKVFSFFIQKECDLDNYMSKSYTDKPYWYQMESGRFPYPPPMWGTTTYYQDDNYKKYTKLPYGAYGRDITKRKKK